jgi:hypothetical protein
LVVLLLAGFTDNTNVAVESHPSALVSVTEYVPALLYVCPFQVYGSWEGHIVRAVLLELTCPTVTVVEQELVFPHASITVHVIVDTPGLKPPPTEVPVPFPLVAPVIRYVTVRPPGQLSDTTTGGMLDAWQKVIGAGHVIVGLITSFEYVTVWVVEDLLPHASITFHVFVIE